ncbi:unnamed protein product [Boreogadus saida]
MEGSALIGITPACSRPPERPAAGRQSDLQQAARATCSRPPERPAAGRQSDLQQATRATCSRPPERPAAGHQSDLQQATRATCSRRRFDEQQATRATCSRPPERPAAGRQSDLQQAPIRRAAQYTVLWSSCLRAGQQEGESVDRPARSPAAMTLEPRSPAVITRYRGYDPMLYYHVLLVMVYVMNSDPLLSRRCYKAVRWC